MVEATSAVVRVVGGELLAGGDTALLLSRCSGVAGELGQPFGALIGEVSHHSTFIAGDCGLVLGSNRNSIASGPWCSVGVVVVGVGGSRRSAVEVAVVVHIGVGVVAVVVGASWPWVSSAPVLKTGARHLVLGLVVSGGKPST